MERENIMEAILSLGIGYLIGCISPSAWISKKKHVDLKNEGTKNLGATNTALVLGKAAGIFVMVLDIAKSFCSYKLAKLLFPHLALAGILACIGAILGHCFPVFMNFQGGKGLAAFGGLVMAYNPWFFVAIVVPGVILMVILNTGVAVPMLASVMFPILVYWQGRNIPETALVIVASVIIVIMHWSNLKRARDHKDVVKTREFFAKVFGKKQS